MKLLLSWLKEYVPIKESPQKLAEDLQFSGTIVNSIEQEAGEVILDFEITPNRPDCLAVIGIAREIAAIYNRKLTVPKPFSKTNIKVTKNKIDFRIKDKRLSPYYSIGIIGKVKVGKSPLWLTKRLGSSGLRSINNIVDISNYVMVETGQPMHAFDYDKIKGGLTLRASKKGESVTTLDGVERKMPDGAIIIEDQEKIIDLAGLMGGENSEVDKRTKTIILHVPLYNSLAIRKTAQYLGLRSEASNRFEKKLDPNAHRYAFERAVQLISELAGGSLISDINSLNYPVKNRQIVFPISLTKQVLGVTLKTEDMKNILRKLQIQIKDVNTKSNEIVLDIPTFRTDLQTAIDIVEELGRLYGYNKLPRKLPTGQIPDKISPQADFEMRLKQHLARLGLKEIYSPSLTDAIELERMGFRSEDCLRVSNRLVIDYEYLRPTLLLGLIQATSLNAKDFNDFSLFELGRVFSKKKQPNGLPYQPKKITAIMYNSNLIRAKGVLSSLLKKFNIAGFELQITKNSAPFGATEATVTLENTKVGRFGEINKDILKKFAISASTYAFELDIETLISNTKERKFTEGLKYPTVKENISLYTAPNTNFSEISSAIIKGAGKHFHHLDLLEDKILNGKRSLLVKIEYFDKNKTLRKSQISAIRADVLKALRDMGAKPRVS